MARRLTDAQLRNQRSQALRAVRRKERTLDTAVEKMERNLDRAIENKESIMMATADRTVVHYRSIHRAAVQLQNAITDMSIIFLSGQ